MSNHDIYNEEFLSLRELLFRVFRGKIYIFALALLGAVLSVLSSRFMETVYRAEVIVGAPVQSFSTNINLGGFPDVGSLLSGSTITNNDKMIKALLSGNSFAKDFVQYSGMNKLVSADDYDADGNWVSEKSELWTGIRAFKNIVSAKYDNDINHLKIYVEWSDPVIAAKWADEVALFASERLKKDRLRSLEDSTKLINQQIKTLAMPTDIKNNLLKQYEKAYFEQLVTNAESSYGISIIDSAVVPNRRSWPSLRFLAVLGFLMGGFLGVVIAIYKEK